MDSSVRVFLSIFHAIKNKQSFACYEYCIRQTTFLFLFSISDASLQTAYSFLKEHPRVISDKVGMLGISLGALVTIFLMAESAVVKASNHSHKYKSMVLCWIS